MNNKKTNTKATKPGTFGSAAETFFNTSHQRRFWRCTRSSPESSKWESRGKVSKTVWGIPEIWTWPYFCFFWSDIAQVSKHLYLKSEAWQYQLDHGIFVIKIENCHLQSAFKPTFAKALMAFISHADFCSAFLPCMNSIFTLSTITQAHEEPTPSTWRTLSRHVCLKPQICSWDAKVCRVSYGPNHAPPKDRKLPFELSSGSAGLPWSLASGVKKGQDH